MSDQELPGMWETADFEGGAPDLVRGGSLRSGPVGPEKWVPEAIAEQEAYLEQMRKERDEPDT